MLSKETAASLPFLFKNKAFPSQAFTRRLITSFPCFPEKRLPAYQSLKHPEKKARTLFSLRGLLCLSIGGNA